MAQAKKKDEAEYALPTSQVDLQSRLDNENRSSRILTTADQYEQPEDDDGRSFAVEGNDLEGYIGTNPEYMTYANETEAPIVAEEGPESEVEENFLEQSEQRGFAVDQEEDDDQVDEDRVDEDASTPPRDTSSSSASSTSTTS